MRSRTLQRLKLAFAPRAWRFGLQTICIPEGPKTETDQPGHPIGLGPKTGTLVILWMDEIHFAPPKKPWNGDSPVNTKKQWFRPWFLRWRALDVATMQGTVCSMYGFQSSKAGAGHLEGHPPKGDPFNSHVGWEGKHRGQALFQRYSSFSWEEG